jgi:hypothetical protein
MGRSSSRSSELSTTCKKSLQHGEKKMQTLDDAPETIHLYIVREKEPTPSVLPIVLSALSLAVLFTFCALIPYQQLVTRAVIRVPAVLLPIRIFTSTVAVIPTGVKMYSATTAHGVLTITNGSIIGQSIPAGFNIQGVTTDYAVYVPGGNANGYGWTHISAHAGNPGENGNIPALAINSVVGSSIYVRNLSEFSGGHDSYSVKFVTAQDKQTALIKVQATLALQINGLHYPCNEVYLSRSKLITMTWRCQFITYSLPLYMHVTDIRIIGKNLLINVWFIAPPTRVWVK